MTTLRALGDLRGAIEDEYCRRTPGSRELHEQAKSLLPGGETRTGTLFAPYPTYIKRGKGNHLYDVDGNKLLDFTNNASSLIHGHAHPEVVSAIQDQAASGTGWNAPHALQVHLAELLCDRVPSLEQVRFCNSGTEANMNAIKAARAFTGRDQIVKMDTAYHGSYEGVEFEASVGTNGTGRDVRPSPTSLGVARSTAENIRTLPFNDTEMADRLITRHRHEIAAVLVNPVVTKDRLLLPSPGYLEFLRETTRRNEVLLIFDEVITLRLARGGAQDYYGVVPDLTAMGKIIGGGLPVGAFGGRGDVMALFADRDPPAVPHAGTFNGNPLTMAAGIACLELLTPAAFNRLTAMGDYLVNRLATVTADFGTLLEVNAITSLATLDISQHLASDPGSVNIAKELQRLVRLALLNRGIKASGILAVSTVMSEAEIDFLADELGAVLSDCKSLVPVAPSG